MEPTIREAREADLQRAAGIFRETYLRAPYGLEWTPQAALAKMREHFAEGRMLVAEAGGRVAGFIIYYCSAWDNGEHGYVVEFATAPEFQGRGIGSALLQRAERELRDRGVTAIELVDVHVKASAFSFYKKRGYHQTEYVRMKKPLT